MLSTLTSLMKSLFDDKPTAPAAQPELAMACLLTEVAGADHDISEQEQLSKKALLTKLTGADEMQVDDWLVQANQHVDNSASLFDFTSQLRELSAEQRYQVIESMWQVANADGHIDPLEDAVIRKTAELLYVDHSQFIRAKLSVVDDQPKP
ncbi:MULTISPECIES: TerB family tellurite resistance protein [unclassified Vibrio]|uniref:TerB family tellurite resistance protein n=1 Tax=Vibrio sp. HB236076 TaxID=3232307 RepID=A0AB39HDB8_9VIBR|nr:TerB family tellurite resistance protein [Vibrio sp. HB161653]MDP5253565.1 TerB family tellurite resistance protein [Vibrio sp. HB161653]